MNEPITQVQDHEGRIGRLEGIAEQLDRRFDGMDKRLDRIEQTLAEQGRRIDALGRRIDALSQQFNAQGRWIFGIQITMLLALGTLILLRLP